jgi:hypothetical protein
MPLIHLSVQHRRTLERAQGQLETAVPKVHSQFGALVRQVTWSADHRPVRLDGVGFWVEMWVDASEVHVSGDLSLLGVLLGRPIGAGLRQILQQAFQNILP